MKNCPHCRAELPDVSDAYCPECREELSAPTIDARPDPHEATPSPDPATSERAAVDHGPVTLNQAGWITVAVLQGVLNLLFIVSVLVWLVLVFVERLQSD